MNRREFLKYICTSSLFFASINRAFSKENLKKQIMSRDEWEKLLSEKFRGEPAFKYIEDNPGLPRILLIGDSISIGYTEPVREILKGRVNVHRIQENGGHTDRGLEKLDLWLRDEKWDLIHFNWGLHDLKYQKNGKLDISGKQVNSPESYENNLDALVKRLKSTKAKLIWANTTPVPDGSNGRKHGDAIKYNRIAESVMSRNEIPINNLFKHVQPFIEKYQKPQNVHFYPEGSKFLAEKVADEILDQLGAIS